MGLPEQPTDTEDDEESQEESLLTPGWLDLRLQNVDVKTIGEDQKQEELRCIDVMIDVIHLKLNVK